MTIRPMTIDDYDAVYALWCSTPGMGLNDLDDSREGIGRYLARNPTTCFVAWEGEALLGAILAGHDGRRGHISHTAVALSARRRGVGTALVEAALAAFRQAVIAKAVLVVFSSNEGGNHFWERLGFSTRPDLTYRNRTLAEMDRIDT